MKIAFVSTRGIPNNYGGFEQFAEYISVGLARRGHDVTVYSPHFHPYKESEYKGVRIKHIHSPEQWMGSSIGSFFYDFKCLKDALQEGDYDIIYEAGYTSIIPAYIWFDIKKRKDVIVTTNMDGLEYKRTKFNPLVRRFVEWEEKMAVKHSHYLVSDNTGIADYFKQKYGKPSKYLAYGADIHDDYNPDIPAEYGLTADGYYLIIARMEPENNIEMAIQGYLASKHKGICPLVLVGKTNTPFAKKLIKKYGSESGIRFIGGIYDFKKINSIRRYSRAYFHGHSVGGTNPSLLEAMASEVMLLAHDNIFNRAVAGDNAIYYRDSHDVTEILDNIDSSISDMKSRIVEANLTTIRERYSWQHLVDLHEDYFKWLIADNRKHATNGN